MHQVQKTAQHSQPVPLEAVQGGSEGTWAAGAVPRLLLSLLSPLIKAALDKSYGHPVPAYPSILTGVGMWEEAGHEHFPETP